jgi:adenylate cyclase
LQPFHTRFGIHVGEVVVGNLGSSERMNYTVLGNVVNLAARLEGLNKQYGTQILVSESVYQRIRHAIAGFSIR